LRVLNLSRATAACFLVAASLVSAAAQTRPVDAPARPTAPRASAAGATADEEFELNIDRRRIDESDFQAETEAEAGGAGGLRLRVGVALRARDIGVLLQGVRGRVRFRANLAPVQHLLDALRGATTPTPAPSPPETSP
jgi:hypothetical protein